jgi:hypothetical protein
MLHPLPGAKVALIVMAGAFQTSDDIYAVGALLDRPQQVPHIHFPGARNSDNFYVGRVLKSHGTCQVRG